MKIFQYQIYDGGIWFRIAGKGLSIVDRTKHPPLFSERKGYKKGFNLFKCRVNFLDN